VPQKDLARHPYPGAPAPDAREPLTAASALTSHDHDVPPVRGPPATIGEDLLEGAEQIADFLGLPVRAIYRLSREVKPQYRAPFFKLSSNVLCARRSTLLAWVAEKERVRLEA
jgi:hypothetical protein